MYKSRENLSPSCSSSEDLVAYLYGEMNPSTQAAFEGHLSECDVCTAEFAELSLARLGVYEWHRDEFVELVTPRVVIPYGETAKASWFDAVLAFFASPARLAAAGSLAVLAIVAGVMITTPSGVEVAGGRPTPSPVVVSNTRDELKPIQDTRPEDIPRGSQTAVDEKPRVGEEPRIVKASSGRNTKTTSPKPVKIKETPRPNQARRPSAAPRLNDFEEEDDTTLRLGDLLAEVDTRD